MKVLDMGSSLNPDILATDAVEIEPSKSGYLKREEKNVINQALDLGMSKEQIKKLQEYRDTHIKIQFGIDYNIKLPFINNSFNIVVSHASMAAIGYGKIKSYMEAYRVLKRGGTLEVCAASGWEPTWIKNTTQHMKQSGFKKITFKRNLQDTRLFFSTMPRMKNDIIYGVKV